MLTSFTTKSLPQVQRAGVFYVYLLFRLDTGVPCYVGKGKGRRCDRHEAYGTRHHNKHLASIIAGSGVAAVKMREELSETEAFDLERLLILTIGRKKNAGPLVNQTDGGDGASGVIASQESRRKRSLSMKALPPRSPEIGRRISAAKKGHEVSSSTRLKISAAQQLFGADKRTAINTAISSRLKGVALKPETICKMRAVREDPEYLAKLSKAMTGQIMSAETKQKISGALKGVPKSPETRAKMVEAQRLRRAKGNAAAF